jgi:hypothetical protein
MTNADPRRGPRVGALRELIDLLERIRTRRSVMIE